ncbi:DltD domain-containing protein [Paenibacillus sp. PK3_47]|uniref:DinB family protein n=1 Tax=Paenibacillus sp. PK3_47 TaxID=2072642 RepID=UPI00201D4D46|nr:DinB family protein [Paenibacillus sp. PK3_47]UQZ32260.1 DltD domain-containing protein [Paenibacillus sp. PK3_47]
MFHTKDVLANQLLANANDASWYVPFTEAVQGLSEEEANWKADGESNSIAEIVNHLLYWNKTWQTRFLQGSIDAVPKVESNDSTFRAASAKPFHELQQLLLEVLLTWQDVLTEEKLQNSIPRLEGSRWWEAVGNVTTHNAYHIGQIVFIRKLRGSYI